MKQQRGDNDVNRHKGGPGSSHQAGAHQGAHRGRDDQRPEPGEPTNPNRARVSGGGGERDIHHTHDPKTKS